MPLNQQQSGAPAARRVLFVVLIVASLVLATVYAREGADGPIHSVQGAVMGVTGGVGGVGMGLGAAAGSVGTAVSDATANPNTLSGLREQNEELRSLLVEAEEYRQEANRLQGLLNMKQSSGVNGPVARVIGRSSNAWDQSITINLGTEEGVEGA
jgi:rod shape-determining protein MreC